MAIETTLTRGPDTCAQGGHYFELDSRARVFRCTKPGCPAERAVVEAAARVAAAAAGEA